MWIIAPKRLKEFWRRFPDAEESLKAWLQIVGKADWTKPSDVRALYGSVDFVGDRAVFNIRGNNYRLVTYIYYQGHVVYIRFIGTHAEYDKIDIEKV